MQWSSPARKLQNGSMQFFVIPQDTRRIADSVNSQYDPLIPKDMSVLVNVLSVLMDLTVHWHISCSALQFKACYKLLKGEMEHV